MNPSLGTALLFAAPVGLGIVLLWLIRWSRRKNQSLRLLGHTSTSQAQAAFYRGEFRLFARLLLFGDASRFEKRLANLLAAVVIAAVIATLVLVSVLLAVRHWQAKLDNSRTPVMQAPAAQSPTNGA